MTQQRPDEERRVAENQHLWADIRRNWKQYRSYAQYSGLQCPECKRKDAFVFHAYYRGRKRYKCKCGTTINDFSQSLMHRSRHPKKWLDFMEMVLRGESLGQMSKELGLSKVTLYRWRKKFMQLATELYQERLQGIIEAEEFEIPPHLKPSFIQHSKNERIDHKQVYLLVAKDRLGNCLFRIKRNRTKLWRAFLQRVQKKSTIHANVPKSGLPNIILPKDVMFFGPSEGRETVEKRDWNSSVCEFLNHFAQTSSKYRSVSSKYLTGFLSLSALKHKLHGNTREQRKAFFMYTLLTNNMSAAHKLVSN